MLRIQFLIVTLLMASFNSNICESAESEPQLSSPKTIDEGLSRLESVLGRYNPDEQKEWRIPTDFEIKQRPNPEDPEILIAFNGLRVVGKPFRGPDSICFDEVWQWRRLVYDFGVNGEKKLVRTQKSHNVTRYTLTVKSGIWLANGIMLTNGVHDRIDSTAFSGIAKWHPDGIELLGNTGVGQFYAAGGKLILGSEFGSVRYVRNGENLVLRNHTQAYRLATDSEGNILTSPDLKQPFGSPFKLEFKSE